MTSVKGEYLTMKIKEVGNLIGGQVISRVEAKPSVDKICGSVKILIPKAIKSGVISHEDITKIDLKTQVDEKKLTKVGDIVIKLSQPYDAAYITKNDEGLLTTSFCIILRGLRSDINLRYFVAFINSQVYKEQAMQMTSGATIPMLTKGKIEQIEFGLPDKKTQDLIVSMNEEIKEKEEIFEEIIRLEKLKLENLLRGEN